MSFLLLLTSNLQQNWRKRQNSFCLEVKGAGRRGRRWGCGRGNGPNNVCTYEQMNKEKKKRKISKMEIHRRA
jgi:hypothetical protein